MSAWRGRSALEAPLFPPYTLGRASPWDGGEIAASRSDRILNHEQKCEASVPSGEAAPGLGADPDLTGHNPV